MCKVVLLEMHELAVRRISPDCVKNRSSAIDVLAGGIVYLVPTGCGDKPLHELSQVHQSDGDILCL